MKDQDEGNGHAEEGDSVIHLKTFFVPRVCVSRSIDNVSSNLSQENKCQIFWPAVHYEY